MSDQSFNFVKKSSVILLLSKTTKITTNVLCERITKIFWLEVINPDQLFEGISQAIINACTCDALRS